MTDVKKIKEILRKVFVNKKNNQALILLPRKMFNGKKIPKKVLLRWFE